MHKDPTQGEGLAVARPHRQLIERLRTVCDLLRLRDRGLEEVDQVLRRIGCSAVEVPVDVLVPGCRNPGLGVLPALEAAAANGASM